jgi:hypothetical protein
MPGIFDKIVFSVAMVAAVVLLFFSIVHPFTVNNSDENKKRYQDLGSVKNKFQPLGKSKELLSSEREINRNRRRIQILFAKIKHLKN